MKIICALPTRTLDPILEEGDLYLKKLRPPLSAKTVFLNPKVVHNLSHKEQRMNAEGQELLKKTEGFYRIALVEEGQSLNSETFATLISKLTHRTSKLAFLVGGAFGLAPSVIEKCDQTLSLSNMTLPHRLAFLVLCEQIFRASEIINQTPYHK